MELENKMLIDSYWNDSMESKDWDEYYNALAEKADEEYEQREEY